MALTPGTRLGVYSITAPIGEGGMGQVYQARDKTLDRDVAIKVLPESFAHDAERLARFQREARTLASLNHPNIAIIHGFEQAGDVHALVMELVEGEDLSQRIARGAIPLDEAVPIATQIAEALEAAHEQGIIHRDLKPANIKVRSDGTVKVLDFGLAKFAQPAEAGLHNRDVGAGFSRLDMTASPTITTPAMMTGAGMILGTAAYMSPEQARGKAVDRRADIWAFGAVLYEMLAGRRPFDGEDMTEVLGAVVRLEPSWEALPSDVPPPVRTLVQGCLVKDPRRRVADISTALFVLDKAASLGALPVGGPQTTATAPSSASRGRLAWMVAAAAVLVAAALAIPALRYLREAPPPETRVDIVTPATSDPLSFALSPDGRQIVFVASGDGASRLWLRPLASTTAQPLAGTEGATFPFWSPDSRSVGFFAGGVLKRLDIGGGAPRTLATAVSRGGTWSADGVILFAPNTTGPLFRISASGGQAAAVTTLDQQTSHRHPFFLSDGRQFLFYAQGTADTSGIYLGSLDSGDTTRLTAADTRGLYLPSGWLLWVRAQALVTQRLDLQQKALTGDPITLADPVATDVRLAGAASVSAAGLVAYRAGGAGLRRLTWFDRTGKAVGVAGEPDANAVLAPELSPDGRRVAIDRTVQGNRDVWLMDLVRGGITRFTFDTAVDGFPIWSPDGSRIAFESRRKGGSYDIWLKPSSGAGTEELLLETPNDEWPYDWSKDGRFLLYQLTDPKTGSDLWSLPMTGNDRKPAVVVNTPFVEQNGQFSPDGRWVAYETNESGRSEIVVQPFPVPSGKWQLSTGGGTQPRWRADGKELYFIAPDGTLMAVTVAASGSTFEAGKPVALFPTNVGLIPKAQYAVSRDGRFLMNQTIEESTAVPITLIQNWNPEGTR